MRRRPGDAKGSSDQSAYYNSTPKHGLVGLYITAAYWFTAADALRVRAFGRDLIRAKGIMARGACESRIEGRTHGRTNQQTVAAPRNHLPTESRPHMALADRQLSALELRKRTFAPRSLTGNP